MKYLCGVVRRLKGPTTPCHGVWGLNVVFNEKGVLYTVRRYSSKEK